MKYVNNKPIAILMAVYNAEPFLREQIDSICGQTNQEWTLYIRDDASSDKSKDIIKEYVANHTNIVLVNDGEGNLGCRGNFFRLLEVVESQYYMFSDADDVWFADKVQISIDEMRKQENKKDEPIIIHTTYTVTDKNLNVLIENYWEHMKFNPENYYSYNLIALANPVGGAEMLFNKKMKDLVFPLAENTLLHDRWIPMVAARNRARIVPVKRPVRFYRMHGGNFYGVAVGNDKNGFFGKLKKIYKDNLLVSGKLKTAGYGYSRYLLYKIVYMIKRKIEIKSYK